MALRILVHEWVTGGGLAGLPLPKVWARDGRAMRQAVVDDFLALGAEAVVTLDPRCASETGPWEAVPVPIGREEPTLRRLAPGCDYTLVIAPETAGTLTSLTELVESVGGRLLGSSSAAVALTADKHRLGAFLQKRGVSTPPVAWYDRPDPGVAPFEFPVVVKPVDGAGSLDTFLLTGPGQRPTPSSWAGDLVVQPYCHGTAMSASYLVGTDGRADLLAVGWQHVELIEGRLVYRGGRLPGPRHLGLGAPLEAVESVSGLRGFVGVDFIQTDEGETIVIEINPRLTTSYVGLKRIYRPGSMSRAWLEAVRGTPGRSSPELIDPVVIEGSVRFGGDEVLEIEDGPRDVE